MTAVHPAWAVSLSHWRSTAVQIGHKHQSWQGWLAYGDTHSTVFWVIPALQIALRVLVQGREGEASSALASFYNTPDSQSLGQEPRLRRSWALWAPNQGLIQGKVASTGLGPQLSPLN